MLLMLRTVDTDVVVLAIAFFHELPLSELWVAFGVGKHLRHVPVHVIASSMGQQKSKALLVFHSFTGCDQTSSFASIGKKKAWEAWAIYDEVTEVFQSLSAASQSQLCQMLFLSFSASRYSCMTVQAHVQPSMLHVRTSSHAKEEIMNQYLQQLTLYYSTQKE